MLWVVVFGGIALAGLAMVVAYGVWLVHKTADLASEVRVLSERGGQIADALAQIGAPSSPPRFGPGPDHRSGDHDGVVSPVTDERADEETMTHA